MEIRPLGEPVFQTSMISLTNARFAFLAYSWLVHDLMVNSVTHYPGCNSMYPMIDLSDGVL